MGAQSTPTVCVRVVLPDDTVLRARVAEASTTGDLVTQIQTHWRDATVPKNQCPEVAMGAEDWTRLFELVLVHSGLVLRGKYLLKDVGVRDGDILEWRAVDDASVPSPSHVDQQDALVCEELETGGSEEDCGELPTESHNADSVTQPAPQRPLKYRPNRRCYPKGVGSLIRPSLKPSLASTQPQHRHRAFSSTEKHDALSRMVPRDFLLRVAFDYLDRLASAQSLSRQLLMQIRDIYSRLGPQPIAALFPVVHALASQTSELLRSEADGIGDTPSLSVRWLYPLISRSVQGTELPIVMQGYVDVAEWVALWRNQRRVYACLCDGAKLLFFANQKLCEEFVFEMAMRGNETTVLDPVEQLDHKRFLRENAPHTTIDLVASKWNVRRGEITNPEAGDGAATRHAFALFDTQGKLRLIMDVATQCEADNWIGAIKNEIRQAKLLNSAVASSDAMLGGFNRLQANNITIPLRWLHGHVDSLTRGQARVERVKSWTLTQALKDLRRDRLQINGIVYSGLCVEEIVGALLMEITRLAPALTPADAMEFTRLLLVTSSRTQGGGDILDAMRLAVGSEGTEQLCFCPVESTQIAPIRIDICHEDQASRSPENRTQHNVVAEIRMQMQYRVFRSKDINERVEQSKNPMEVALQETCNELQLTGVYHRQLVCCGEHWNRLDGYVSITVDRA